MTPAPAGDKLFNRELSWLEFNARVLAEAMDPSNPLLERLKFLGIVSSNFDEFFMVRIVSLHDQGEIEKRVRDKAFELITQQNRYFIETVVPELEKAGAVRVLPQALTPEQLEYVRTLFFKELFPVLTPMAVYEDRPAPALVNLSLYMAVRLVNPDETSMQNYAVIEIPRNYPRMVVLPSEKGFRFVLLEDLVALFAKEFFSGYEIVQHGFLRITRAAEMTIDEEKDEDFAKIMSDALRLRNQNEIVLLETSAPEPMVEFFMAKLGVAAEEVFRSDSWLDLKSISQLAFQPILEEQKRPAWVPRPQHDFANADNLWDMLKQKDIWLHLPYESFDCVTRFVAEAAADPDVLAIKQTFYRAAPDSAMIRALERAAEKGKRVTVLVELKARFDEEKNIEWAKRLEVAGASVLYGVAGFKTHAKACLVVRREPDGIRRYVHLSTGNYNEKTAQIYSDIGYFSSDEALGADLSAFFNMITGFSRPAAFTKIDVAPYGLRRRLKRLIVREAMRSTAENPGFIMAKMNSLVDPELIHSLYDASQAGVHIKLNVRGVCSLKPGIKGLSDNIEVTSILDMFLEHSRMYYFHNGGEEEIFLASADWMPRNLDRRVEIMWPVEHREIRKELIDVLKHYFRDNMKSWKLLPDGSYVKIRPAEQEKKFRVQEYFSKRAADRAEKLEKIVPSELKPQKPVSTKRVAE